MSARSQGHVYLASERDLGSNITQELLPLRNTASFFSFPFAIARRALPARWPGSNLFACSFRGTAKVMSLVVFQSGCFKLAVGVERICIISKLHSLEETVPIRKHYDRGYLRQSPLPPIVPTRERSVEGRDGTPTTTSDLYAAAAGAQPSPGVFRTHDRLIPCIARIFGRMVRARDPRYKS